MKSRPLILAAALITLGPSWAIGQTQSDRGSPEITCRKVVSGSQGPCSANEYLLRRLERDGLAVALAALDSLARGDAEVRRLGHAYAHSIGIAAFELNADVGDTFAACTPIFQSGCYHGVIQGYFTAQGTVPGGSLDVAVVNGLCTDQRADPALRWQLFQCAHGLGHGVSLVVGSRLPDALAACDLVTDVWEREVCYSAVFMENIVQATSTETSLGRPTHAGHGGTSASDFPPLDRDDPLYPCSVLDERYLAACYQMQTSAILQLNEFDVSIAAAACPAAPEPFIATCFQSLGRDISALTVQDHGQALAMCGEAPEEYRHFCHLGYAKNLVDVSADPDDGFAFCRILPEGVSKRTCYIGMGEQLWALDPRDEVRRALCDGAESGYREACRMGAGVEPAGSAGPAAS